MLNGEHPIKKIKHDLYHPSLKLNIKHLLNSFQFEVAFFIFKKNLKQING